MNDLRIMRNLSEWNSDYSVYSKMFSEVATAVTTDHTCVRGFQICGIKMQLLGASLRAEYIGRKFIISLRLMPGHKSSAMIVCREVLDGEKLSLAESMVFLDALGNIRHADGSETKWTFSSRVDAVTVFLYLIHECVQMQTEGALTHQI